MSSGVEDVSNPNGNKHKLKRKKQMMKLPCCSPLMLAGPTSCGKTYWVTKLLTNNSFKQSISSILYCYCVYQDGYDTLRKKLADKKIPIEFQEGVPTLEDFTRIRRKKGLHIVVLDDMMEKICKSETCQELFTKYAHHFNITPIYICQNIFNQGKCSRTIALNTHLLILFANHRDKLQIRTLAGQQCPSAPKAFLETYQFTACKKKYGYLLVDCSPWTNSKFRWRTNIFPDEGPTKGYDIKKHIE